MQTSNVNMSEKRLTGGFGGDQLRTIELLKLNVESKPKFVGFVRRAVEDVISLMHLNDQEIADVLLAVGEACNNAVLYTTQLNDARLKVICSVEEVAPKPGDYKSLLIEIRNSGSGFDLNRPKQNYQMPPAERLDDHGRGMPLMQMLMDSVEVFYEDGETVVRLCKQL